MATANARERARESPLKVTAILSVIGYILVLGTFAGILPIYPHIGRGTIDMLSDGIAIVNTIATFSLALGWYWIRNGEVRKHRAAMITSFVLILVFLALYLTKVGGGGGEKHIDLVHTSILYYAYVIMLAIHIMLSVISVPVVLFAIVLGLSHTPAELRNTPHKKIGRIAASAWILSLSLGVITFAMLAHYGWTIPK
ncbi:MULTISPECIES: DUF420 domain-containing protein [unclassified Haladaptatus]|uniref:DUF420 domain-containing protein n=1 Tax=unclassified Haladaptatus TaxID=2622732 RepID=UPI00209C2D0D|nr:MULTISPECIES: DUF420 domain-containing protein [unclassified Haladaptatus]MCO8246102.1 DUF420 domain-containing protein [Haladaptatus sp. AB643]MCO8254278.1 DUF420 domain-containing protein [Haladaptatus sp. AB618]